MNHVRNGKRVLFGLPFAMCLCLVPWPSFPSPLALCTSPLPLLLLLAQVDSILCFFTRISSLLPLPPHVLYAIYFMLVFFCFFYLFFIFFFYVFACCVFVALFMSCSVVFFCVRLTLRMLNTKTSRETERKKKRESEWERVWSHWIKSGSWCQVPAQWHNGSFQALRQPTVFARFDAAPTNQIRGGHNYASRFCFCLFFYIFSLFCFVPNWKSSCCLEVADMLLSNFHQHMSNGRDGSELQLEGERGLLRVKSSYKNPFNPTLNGRSVNCWHFGLGLARHDKGAQGAWLCYTIAMLHSSCCCCTQDMHVLQRLPVWSALASKQQCSRRHHRRRRRRLHRVFVKHLHK